MTKEEILAMEVGEKLDAYVAEKVMGHPMPDFIPEGALDLYLAGAPVHYGSWLCVCRYDEGDVPKWVPDPYSTDISVAWQIIGKMSEDGWRVRITERAESINQHWGVCFVDYRIKDLKKADRPVKCAFHQEVPEAICKAALLTRLDEIKRLEKGSV